MFTEPRLLAFLGLLSTLSAVQAVPTSLETRAVTPLSTGQVAAYRPYTHYAAASYCSPADTLSWNCGAHCSATPNFHPVASGGDGTFVQYWYVGYDTSLRTVIVAHQGTDPSRILPLLTDADAIFTSPDHSLFPNLDRNIQIHEGFARAHSLSAKDVLSAVKSALSKSGATKITIVGHSLGGAIALLSSVYLPQHLESEISYKLVTYGSPRVGNSPFVRYVNSHASDVSRINNKKDPIPILPGLFLGFQHVNGEKHILESSEWVNCPGQDNEDAQCSTGDVQNIFSGVQSDHDGPYDGVSMGC